MAIEYAGKSIRNGSSVYDSFLLLNVPLEWIIENPMSMWENNNFDMFWEEEIVNLSSLKILNASLFSISRNKIDFLSCSIIISFQRGTLDF